MNPGLVILDFFLGVLLQIHSAQARSGAVDMSFDPGSSPDFTVFALAAQPDGKIVIGGEFGTPGCAIARLNADGSPDKTFNPGKGVNNYDYVVGLGHVYSVAIQADGKLIIAGVFATFNGVARNGIARLNPDGSLDPSFDPGTGPGVAIPNIYAVALQPDGKVLVVGDFNSFNGISRNGVARLNTDGSVDTSFDPGTGVVGFPGSVYSVALQSNGQVLVGGFFTTVNGANRNQIARLNANGSVDAAFDPGPGPNNAILSMAVQSDGKVIIGGRFTTVNGTLHDRIARLNSNGTLDTNFTANGATGGVSDVISVALQSDGKVLIGGKFSTVNGVGRNRIARLNTDGTLDTNFNPGTGPNSEVDFVALQSNAQPLIGGSFTSVNGAARDYIARLNPDGTVDASFNPGASPAAQANALARQVDGKVLIAGNFTDVSRTSRGRIARLNSDGTLDQNFDPGGSLEGSSAGAVYALAVQTNGQVLVGGSFASVNTVGSNAVARLNSDGSLDTGYNPILSLGASVYALVLQPDQRAILAGTFAVGTGILRPNIGRLNPDGTVDASFNPGKGANAAVRAIALQADGRVIIGGDFTAYNGTNRNSIARLNSDGSLDLTFDPGMGVTQGFPTHVQTLALQPDGKVLLGGRFGAVNGAGAEGVARLNGDGSRDTNFFHLQIGQGITVYSLALQSDGKVVIGGEFVEVNSNPRGHIARLNPNGSLDTGYDPGAGTTGPLYPFVYTILSQLDGTALIGGGFTVVDHTARWWVARLLGDVLLINPVVVTNGNITLNWNAISGRTYRVQSKSDLNITNWTDLSPDIIAASTNAAGTFTLGGNQGFYRVVLLP